jgi:sugar/nucleoside kinase (ribokinase family)
MAGLAVLILKKGASVGIKLLYWVVAILFISLFLFFLGKTGYSVILDANNDRTALVYKGCNDKIPIDKKQIKRLKAKWFYIASVTEKMFGIAKEIAEKKAKICFNPSSYMTKKGLTYLRPILKNTYCLILNNEEAELLTNNANILENLRLLKKKIVFDGIVVITAGKKGAYSYHDGKTYFLKANNIEVKESTGAGDAFASGFILGIIKKHTIDFSMKMGMINAEHTIQKFGAKEGLLGKTLTHLAKLDEKKVRVK